MKVFIVRHGQIPSNVLRKYPAVDEELTDIGREQAVELREKIKDMNFDLIICSPLKRAKQTAEIINANRYTIVYDYRIKEQDYGDLTGKNGYYVSREKRWDYYYNGKFGTSERIRPFFNRVFDFLNDLKTKDYNNVLIVAHSGVAKAFNAYFEGINEGKFSDVKIENCEIKQYELK
ncbi:MAG: histidine phosphatase family protein [Clostridia bacterium]|nr:histidine phosphatase family protein [Clostridia bacterium]